MTREQSKHLKSSVHRVTLQGALDVFLLDCQARRLAPGTETFYRQKLGNLIKFLEAQDVVEVEDITPTHVRAFLVHLQDKGHNPGGQRAHFRSAKTWLRFLEDEELLTKSPMHRVKMPRVPRRILPAFTLEDVDQLLDACLYVRDEAMILCLLDSGCRAAEFISLNVEDIDMRSGAVRVRRGKGDKGRVVFLGVKARRALHRYLVNRGDASPSSPLWASMNTGERLTYSGLRLALKRLGRDAGVEHCHPHTFRRTFALWSLRAGMNIYALQSLMGHADLTMLRRYLALVETDLEDAHRRHGPVDAHLKK